MNYSLIIPIFNEERSIVQLMSQLQKFEDLVDIIIINDGSDDKTKSILTRQNSFKVIHHQNNLGKGASILNGVRQALNDNIILMDGDLEIEMSCVLEGIKAYEDNSSEVVVNGCRWNSNNQNLLNINTYGNFLINFIFNLLYKSKTKDVLCCFKILKKSLFESLIITSKAFTIEIEIMSKLALKGLSFMKLRLIIKEGKK